VKTACNWRRATRDAVNSIPMTGLELPQVVGLSVVSGEPVSVNDLRGQSGPAGPRRARLNPCLSQ